MKEGGISRSRRNWRFTHPWSEKGARWRVTRVYREEAAKRSGERAEQGVDGPPAPVDHDVTGLHRLPQPVSAEDDARDGVGVALDRRITEVFGWDTKSFDMGGAEMVMWTVPGYVGGEPQQPVPRDVVAVMLPPDANGEAPPHWSVDFWVANVDAATAKVTELGGKVVLPPFDVPNTGLRQAVVIDPQGATLSLTQPPGA
jgi:predicted enzyme related to lactoylglutathione lyase